mmetsp:Transcript_19987/g.48959  ORF Transcript_19987/g.48959 Transcript_19987/m.48959 type:complete len:179 (-) Transcript_19987:197-733(-)
MKPRRLQSVELDTVKSYDVLEPLRSLPPLPSFPITARGERVINLKKFVLPGSLLLNLFLICSIMAFGWRPENGHSAQVVEKCGAFDTTDSETETHNLSSSALEFDGRAEGELKSGLKGQSESRFADSRFADALDDVGHEEEEFGFEKNDLPLEDFVDSRADGDSERQLEDEELPTEYT